MNRAYAYGIALAIGLVTAFALYQPQQTGAQAAPSGPEIGASLPMPTAPASIKHQADAGRELLVASSPSSGTRPELQTLLRRLNDSRSYRQYIAEALKDARHGGFIYATEAGQQCDRFHSARDSAKPQATSNQALQSAALLEARCDITSDEFFQQLTAALTAEKVPLDSDPLFAMLLPGSTRSKGDSLRRARMLLDSGDPIAMQSLIYLETKPSRDPGGDTGGYFDGQHYRSVAERASLNDAWLLVQCKLGVACGTDATQTLLLCATRDWCGSSVAEAIEIGRGPDGTFAQVQALANSLLDAIRDRRAAAFVPES